MHLPLHQQHFAIAPTPTPDTDSSSDFNFNPYMSRSPPSDRAASGPALDPGASGPLAPPPTTTTTNTQPAMEFAIPPFLWTSSQQQQQQQQRQYAQGGDPFAPFAGLDPFAVLFNAYGEAASDKDDKFARVINSASPKDASDSRMEPDGHGNNYTSYSEYYPPTSAPSTTFTAYAPPPGPPPPGATTALVVSPYHSSPSHSPPAITQGESSSPPLPAVRTRDERGMPFYASTGFDMLSILASVVNRTQPQIDIGPVDMSCAFVVVDVREPDEPIVYASPTFLLLTGYAEQEVVGRNCRFLQSPDGAVGAGEDRKWTGAREVYAMKHHLGKGREVQVELINYRKGGARFLNLVTVVPVPDPKTGDDRAFLVGFQVDLSEGPNQAMSKLRDGSYLGDYHTMGLPPALRTHGVENYAVSRDLPAVLGTDADDVQNAVAQLLLEHNSDFIHVLSLKGAYLYVSPSITRALGYEPNDLMGKSVSDLCHPADRVPLERELKDAGIAQAGTVRLLYRMRLGPGFSSSSSSSTMPSMSSMGYTTSISAPAGFAVSPQQSTMASSTSTPSIFAPSAPEYVWVESAGRLHLEPGKGRKAIIMCARRVRVPPRPHGGVGGLRGWAVLDASFGTVLSSSNGSRHTTLHVPEPGAHFAEIARPPASELLRRVLASNSASIGALAIDLAEGGRAKVILSSKEDRVLAEVRDDGDSPAQAHRHEELLAELETDHAQSWQYTLNHLKQQNAALREKLEARNSATSRPGSAPAPAVLPATISLLGKRSSLE
ncbi:hypothetical protein EXIGLDRAFT_737125 [Exidia glandulosa HHB12029]|uniref:PAS domain-containing protein n=1 Tax=Exidia glandulosa HHB12029 TaxID=1314781 RepID=A0A165J604_EXIGL|nr:hypothetical protein EXIGLDRAFT_737125 [Exidia glandulosa HHB12029]